MDIKLIASDLDGTIIDRNNHISEKNFEAISEIHNKNIDFVVCTGKSYSVSQKICEQFDASYGIFGNGTQIIDLKTNKEIMKKTISKQDLLFIITLAKRNNFHVHIYTDKQIISEKLEYMDLRNYVLKKDNANDNLDFLIVEDILAYIENNNLNVFSLVVTSENTSLSEFQKILSINNNIDSVFINKRGKYRDNIINKDYEYLNISPENVNKNEALTFLANYLKISKNNILAIGDNINDLEMVKNAGIGIAVHEAIEELQSVATYVTTLTATEGAFAEGILKYIK